jgi:hypothetical protein
MYMLPLSTLLLQKHQSIKVTNKLKMQVLHAFICMVMLLGNTFAACPHTQAGLKKWSDAATWGTAGKVSSKFVCIFGLLC